MNTRAESIPNQVWQPATRVTGQLQVVALVMTNRTNKPDRRLLGHWKSDRRRTMAEWKWPPRTSIKKKRFATSLFGHLKLRYTPRFVYSDYKGMKSREPYEVLGSDSFSVAIATGEPVTGEVRIYQMNFEDGGYWISLGRQREWFRRPRKARGKAS